MLSLILCCASVMQSGQIVDEDVFGRPPLIDKQRKLERDSIIPPFDRRGGSDHGDVQVSTPSTFNQNETVIRINPLDRLNLIGGANDNRNGGNYTCAFYSSLDGGLTWSELIYVPTTLGSAGDPAAAFGPNGEAYFCPLEFGSTSSIIVGRSFDGGVTVPTWVTAVPPNSNRFEDKQYMVADDTPGPLSGAVYVSWTRFRAGFSEYPIFMVASFDQGQNWSVPKKVSDSLSCQGSVPAVGPNSELYVAFFDYVDSSIKVDVSFDGGATWGTDIKVSDVDSIGSVPNTFFRANSFPTMDVDTSGGPYHGYLYVCWADSQGSHTDVLFSRSTDGGQTWSNPIPAHDVTDKSQFFPWLDVDPNGNINVGMYDRRDNAADTRCAYYVSRSSDGGLSFLPSVRVSDVGFNPNNYSDGGFIGDYTGLAASDRTLHPLWTDGRNATNDAFTSRVQLDISTDVNVISATTGGIVNLALNVGPLYQGAGYRILGSFSGTSPGLTFSNGINVPVNFDGFMLLTIQLANTPALQNFFGVLDGTGSALATVDTGGPLDPSLVGLEMDFAAFAHVGNSVLWSSNPTHLRIDP